MSTVSATATGRFTRRQVLALAGAGVGLLAASGLTACSSSAPDPSAHPWQARRPLRVPPVLRPGPQGGTDLVVQAGRHEFVPGRPAPTWGINGPVLGPTIRVRRGEHFAPRVRNTLAETTTMHWHGVRLPAAADGGPHQPIASGETWTPAFVVDQPAATCWYHPHPHGATARHVHRGLAGLLLIDEPVGAPGAATARAWLPQEYGVDDLPVVIQDRTFGPDGALVEDSRATWGLMGEEIVCNATREAYVDIVAERTRLRLLNGSNARVYHLVLDDGRSFHVVAGDAGLLPTAVATDSLTVSPGERAEIVVTLRPGERVRLASRAGREDLDAGDFPILELRAAAALRPSPQLAPDLGGAPPMRPPAGARVREFTLQGHDAINGRSMDMSRIDEVVPAETTEIWRVRNTVYAHNVHIHGVDFTILDLDGAPPPPALAGRKDTVYLPSRASATLAVRFGSHVDPVLPYMYHCHLLRHEDAGMMGQFIVVPPGNEQAPAPVVPASPSTGHGH